LPIVKNCMFDKVISFSLCCCNFAIQIGLNLRVLIVVLRPGHDVKLHPHFHCHLQLFVLMCHEADQSAFLLTLLYLSTNLDHILFSNVSWH